MPKHNRRWIIEQRLRHEGRVQMLADRYGMREPWRTLWIMKAHHKYPRWAWQNYEKQGYSIQERRLDLHDEADYD